MFKLTRNLANKLTLPKLSAMLRTQGQYQLREIHLFYKIRNKSKQIIFLYQITSIV
jgi:hypothetical protein